MEAHRSTTAPVAFERAVSAAPSTTSNPSHRPVVVQPTSAGASRKSREGVVPITCADFKCDRVGAAVCLMRAGFLTHSEAPCESNRVSVRGGRVGKDPPQAKLGKPERDNCAARFRGVAMSPCGRCELTPEFGLDGIPSGLSNSAAADEHGAVHDCQLIPDSWPRQRPLDHHVDEVSDIRPRTCSPRSVFQVSRVGLIRVHRVDVDEREIAEQESGRLKFHRPSVMSMMQLYVRARLRPRQRLD
jgi:hypothetical protein